MGLDFAKKFKLDKLKSQLSNKVGNAKFKKVIDDVNLNNISLPDLKSLTDSRYTQGVAWGALPLATMSSGVMNSIAPGSINNRELKNKLANTSLTKGRVTDLVDTQSGVMAVTSEVKVNGDVEDVFQAKSLSQGTNLQMANRAQQINTERSSTKSIQSNFVGDEVLV